MTHNNYSNNKVNEVKTFVCNCNTASPRKEQSVTAGLQMHRPGITDLLVNNHRQTRANDSETSTPPKPSYGTVFTALHGMQTRSSDENSVCLSVSPSTYPSVTRVNCDKTVKRSVQIYIPYERSFSLVF